MGNKTSNNIYELFASALSYPNEKVLHDLELLYNLLNKNYPEAFKVISEFFEFIKTAQLQDWEEIYTRTFDVQAITTLDVGYVLFGDDYKRGELLVNLNKEHTKANNNCSTELADHLPNLLRLITKTDDEEFNNELIYLIIKPALKKIISEFDKINIERKNKIYKKHHKTLIPIEEKNGLVYKYLLESLLITMNTNFPDDDKYSLFSEKSQTEFAKELEIPD